MKRPGFAPYRPCGTLAAYTRHIRNNDPTCAECRAAWAEYHRARREKRRG